MYNTNNIMNKLNNTDSNQGEKTTKQKEAKTEVEQKTKSGRLDSE